MNTQEHDHEEDIQVEKEIKTFEARWRYAVFPAMLAFVILSAFGFYLIYGMLMRMEELSGQVERMTSVIEKTMPEMSQDMTEIQQTIAYSMPAIEQRVAEMSRSTHNIAVTTGHMGNSVWEMNRNVSSPMKIMKNMMPFFGGSSAPRPPRPLPLAENAPQLQQQPAVHHQPTGQQAQQGYTMPTMPTQPVYYQPVQHQVQQYY